jgi:hypothetical protein
MTSLLLASVAWPAQAIHAATRCFRPALVFPVFIYLLLLLTLPALDCMHLISIYHFQSVWIAASFDPSCHGMEPRCPTIFEELANPSN